jgi:hypothetical protein
MQVCQFFFKDQVSHWPTEEQAVKSFALSNLLLQKAYQNVTVITDKPSANLLTELIGIRSESMEILLGDIDKSRGALTDKEVKVHIWNRVDRPFLLVDSDVYLWRRLNDHLPENDLFLFCTESGDRACFQEMVSVREKYEEANTMFANTKINVDARLYFMTANTKICGGNHQIYNNYTKSIQDLLSEEKHPFPAKYINAIERYFILSYLKKIGLEYSTILDFPLNYKSNIYSIFEDIGRKTGVTWVPDELKSKRDIGNFLSLKLRELFPAHANTIDCYYQHDHTRHNNAAIPDKAHSPLQPSCTQHFPRTKAALIELKYLTESQIANDVSDFITTTESLIGVSDENAELLTDVFKFELTKFNRPHLTNYSTIQERSINQYKLYTTVADSNHQEFLAKRLYFNPEALLHRSKYNWAVYDKSIPELYVLKVLYNVCNEAERYYTIFTPSTTVLSVELKLNELDVILIDAFQQAESVIAGIEKVIERTSVIQKDLQRTVGYLIETIKQFVFHGILIPEQK